MLVSPCFTISVQRSLRQERVAAPQRHLPRPLRQPQQRLPHRRQAGVRAALHRLRPRRPNVRRGRRRPRDRGRGGGPPQENVPDAGRLGVEKG